MLLRKLTNAIQPKPSTSNSTTTTTAATAATTTSSDNNAMSGYLKKMGEVNKSFKERYFVLDSVSYRLYYYKSHTSNSAINFIQVEESYVRIVMDSPTENMFELVTAGRIFQLIAPDMEQCQQWCQKLSQISKIEQDNLFIQNTEFKVEETEFKLQKQIFEKEEPELKTKLKQILEKKEKREEKNGTFIRAGSPSSPNNTTTVSSNNNSHIHQRMLLHHPSVISLSPQQQIQSKEEEEIVEEDFIPLSPTVNSIVNSSSAEQTNVMTPTFAAFLHQEKNLVQEEEEEEQDSEEEEENDS